MIQTNWESERGKEEEGEIGIMYNVCCLIIDLKLHCEAFRSTVVCRRYNFLYGPVRRGF